MSTSSSYRCALVETHDGRSGHVPGYIEDAINRHAQEGWRFVQAIRMDDYRFMLILERMEG